MASEYLVTETATHRVIAEDEVAACNLVAACCGKFETSRSYEADEIARTYYSEQHGEYIRIADMHPAHARNAALKRARDRGSLFGDDTITALLRRACERADD